MRPEQQPWWASEPGSTPPDRAATPGRGAPEDHLDAHRAARRGSGPDVADDAADDVTDGTAGRAASGAGSAGGVGASARSGSDEGAADHVAEVCGVCPICVLARSVGDSRPELLAHLTQAAHHLAAAARSVLETPTPPRSDDTVERIDLDPRSGS